jgi:phosphate/sulfate permease
MPIRTVIEALHLAAGLGATVALAALFAWSYPQATVTIWVVAAVAGVLVALMGVRPIRRALQEDKARRAHG